jgi:type II secretory pathway component PulM
MEALGLFQTLVIIHQNIWRPIPESCENVKYNAQYMGLNT